MASKEAKSDSPAESKAAAAETFAFEFTLSKDKIGAATTNKQVKSKVNDAFLGYGAFDQCSVKGDVGEDRTVVVFFARLFGKGQPAWEALQKGEKPTITIYDEAVELSQSTAKPSGGGATSGTSSRPKKEAKAGEKKAGGRGRGRGRGEAKEGEAKDGESKEGKGAGGDRKEGGRGRGRGKKEEKKGPSLQRGRANIGGKLGPVSKVRLAKIEKERKEKERKDREAKGEKVEEDKKEDEKEEKAPEPKKDAKKEGGKKEGGKKEGGKKEAGKAEGGKKEGAKAEGGKKEAGKKGK